MVGLEELFNIAIISCRVHNLSDNVFLCSSLFGFQGPKGELGGNGAPGGDGERVRHAF